MTIPSTGLDPAGTVFIAINPAPQDEGFSASEAFRFADCGARLPAVIPTRPRPPGGA